MSTPTSFNCACTTCISWMNVGFVQLLSVKEKPFAMPPSASFALAFAGSRFQSVKSRSCAHMLGGNGLHAGEPWPW